MAVEDRMRYQTQLFIRPSSSEERVEVIEFLESEGFEYADFPDREDVLESRFPVVADIEEKRIGRMGNATMAACAATTEVLLTVDEFYELYSERSCSYASSSRIARCRALQLTRT